MNTLNSVFHRKTKYLCVIVLSASLWGMAGSAVVRSANISHQYKRLVPFEDLSLQEDALEVYDKAVAAFSHHKYTEAEMLFCKVLRIMPKNVDAKYNLGAIAEWQNNLPKALKYYSEALALRPNDADFRGAVKEVQLKMQLAKAPTSGVDSSFNSRRTGTAAGAPQKIAMAIAWEAWHKNICAMIYSAWMMSPKVAGDATVNITVDRWGRTNYQIKNYSVNPAEIVVSNQPQLFAQTVASSLQLLDPSALRFPVGSQRDSMMISTRFSHSDIDDGRQGYTWKSGDYETINLMTNR